MPAASRSCEVKAAVEAPMLPMPPLHALKSHPRLHGARCTYVVYAPGALRFLALDPLSQPPSSFSSFVFNVSLERAARRSCCQLFPRTHKRSASQRLASCDSRLSDSRHADSRHADSPHADSRVATRQASTGPVN